MVWQQHDTVDTMIVVTLALTRKSPSNDFPHSRFAWKNGNRLWTVRGRWEKEELALEDRRDEGRKRKKRETKVGAVDWRKTECNGARDEQLGWGGEGR